MARKNKYPYYAVIDLEGTVITILDINSIKKRYKKEDVVMFKDEFEENEDNHIIHKIEIPGTNAESKRIAHRLQKFIDDPRLIPIYNHKFDSFHIEYIHAWPLLAKYLDYDYNEIVTDKAPSKTEGLYDDDEDTKNLMNEIDRSVE